jgi:hypothetical protein
LDVEQIIPLPEATDYLTKLRAREEGEQKAKVINKQNEEKKYNEFWSGFFESNERHRTLFPKRSGGSPYVQTSSLKELNSRLQLSCKIFDDKARVYVYLTNDMREENKRIFRLIESEKEFIHAQLGFELIWDLMESSKACKIYIDRQGAGLGSEQEKWAEVYSWMIETAIKMDKIFTTVVGKLIPIAKTS